MTIRLKVPERYRHLPSTDGRQLARRLIIALCYDAPKPLTRREIAMALSLKKTPYLIAIIEELVLENQLKKHVTQRANQLPTYTYTSVGKAKELENARSFWESLNGE